MEDERPNMARRNSTPYTRPFERRPSKKSSSTDRHGIVYPDILPPHSTIRTVTPDSADDAGAQSPLSESDFVTHSLGPSPRSTVRFKGSDRDRDRDFSPYQSSGADEEDAMPPPPPEPARVQRARSKTTTLEDQRSEMSPASSGRRNRLGSINTPAASLTSKVSRESVASIGYPSIIQSPNASVTGSSGQSSGSSRPRLTKAPPADLQNAASRTPASSVSPVSHADSARILQLMKTTCGRMHGILSFRTGPNSSWTSGYCAINVATGSLIYQAKGEVALAKTLISDLRGCRVRTLYDSELQTTYLNVSTYSSGTTIQLKPHVHETFDSWLAALLCWQPIRPKGVQNKRTKPQSVNFGERRLVDRRRNSESTIQKEAAIIKVGTMHLWEQPNASGPPRLSRRASSQRQQQQQGQLQEERARSSAWQQVNCTLQENGYFKLYANNTLKVTIPLSQLSRCAVQQLEPSVLDDEYCLAIYPQYAAQPMTEPLSRPVFLSLESRVLFEVWFVLLRAFTTPELYGPESALSDDSKGQTSTTDMFRIERTLHVRITEAKLRRPADHQPPRSRTQSRTPGGDKGPGHDYYTEVLLDGDVRAKTAVKQNTTNPFWREDFTFSDLPPALSNVSVLLKTLNSSQKDWTLISRSPYTIDSQDNPMDILEDLEVASHDANCGRVDIRLDELEPGVDHEKWWPILDERDQQVGEMYMKLRLDEIVVLMSQEYEPMSKLLHTFPNNLTLNMVQVIPSELNQLSEILLNIFQVSGQAIDWISALIEDEIDGAGKDTSAATRLRYATRLHSNESRESAHDREVIVRDLGRSATIEANLLFRGNSLLTKALEMHMRRLGREYLEETIGEKIRAVDEKDPDCEVDPGRLSRQNDLDRNWKNLLSLTNQFWEAISQSASRCPAELRLIFRHVRACAEDRYGDFLRTVTYSSVSGFLFLRFFCPAILNPKLFGLMKEHPRPRAQRTLTLIAKALQGLANMTTFGSKEPWMEPMNKFLNSNRSSFKQFVDQICAIPADRPPQTVSPQYATPIHILGRLPPTSREGFPSLPFLIDHARSFAVLTNLWLEKSAGQLDDMQDIEPSLAKFHELALQVQQRTRECLSKAEQAERPSNNLEVKWEELVESMDRQATFYDESSSIPTTPGVEVPSFAGGNRNSTGYFSSRPAMPRRSTDTAYTERRLAPDETEAPEAEEDEVEGGDEEEQDQTPPSSASATFDHSRLPFEMSQPQQQEQSQPRGSSVAKTMSKNSSQHSLESPNATTTEPNSSKSRQSTLGRDTRSKYRGFLELVPGQSRRSKHKGENRENREEPSAQ